MAKFQRPENNEQRTAVKSVAKNKNKPAKKQAHHATLLHSANAIAKGAIFKEKASVVICHKIFERLNQEKKSNGTAKNGNAPIADGLYPKVAIIPTDASVSFLAQTLHEANNRRQLPQTNENMGEGTRETAQEMIQTNSCKNWTSIRNCVLFLGSDDLFTNSADSLTESIGNVIKEVSIRMNPEHKEHNPKKKLIVVLPPVIGPIPNQEKAQKIANDFVKKENHQALKTTTVELIFVKLDIDKIKEKHPGFVFKQQPWHLAPHVLQLLLSNILEEAEITWSKKKMLEMSKGRSIEKNVMPFITVYKPSQPEEQTKSSEAPPKPAQPIEENILEEETAVPTLFTALYPNKKPSNPQSRRKRPSNPAKTNL